MELFISGRKLNVSLVFIIESYFGVARDVRLNATHFFIMKILRKRELQQISTNHSSDIDFDEFKRLYINFHAEPFLFLVTDTTIPSDNIFRF